MIWSNIRINKANIKIKSKLERFNKIIKVASEQSKRNIIPTLNKTINRMYSSDIKNMNMLATSLIVDSEEVIKNG